MRTLFFLSFIFCFFSSSAQQGIADTIHWRSDYRLKPDDYQGNPPSNSDFSAVSKIIIRYVPYYTSKGKTGFRVTCFFKKSTSWIIDKRDSTYLLLHEKGHFDLAEVYTRKLKKRLDSLAQKEITDDEISKQAKALFDETLRELDTIDKQYDEETNYSINRPKQQNWIKMIAEMLNSSAITDTSKTIR